MNATDGTTKSVADSVELAKEVIQDAFSVKTVDESTSSKGTATTEPTPVILTHTALENVLEGDATTNSSTGRLGAEATVDASTENAKESLASEVTPEGADETSTDNTKTNDSENATSPKAPKRSLNPFTLDSPESPPADKQPRVEDYMPIEVLQTLQQLSIPKLGHNGLPCRPVAMTIVNGKPMMPEMGPLEQCQQLQQIQGLIHYHEQQVKYRSYIQLEMLRSLRKQLSDQMLAHPHRHNWDAFAEAALNNRLTPLSLAEKNQLEYYSNMADWTLEARALLQNKETPTYLNLFGRQVSEFKARLNEIKTHEGFLVYGAMFAERIDYHRELIHTLNRRSCVTIV